MKRDRTNDGQDSPGPDEKQASPSNEPEGISAFEAKRLRARRQILKGGIGGATAVILSLYQRRSAATHDGGVDQQQNVMSVECPERNGQKVGVSVCMSARLMN